MSEDETTDKILEEVPEVPRDQAPEWEYDDERGEQLYQEAKAFKNLEKDFESEICQICESNGWVYERQRRVANGVIDILVFQATPEIIEVKRYGTPFYLMQAVVQLKFYGACFRRANLFIAVPGGIDDQYRHILTEFGVTEIRVVVGEDGKKSLKPVRDDGSLC